MTNPGNAPSPRKETKAILNHFYFLSDRSLEGRPLRSAPGESSLIRFSGRSKLCRRFAHLPCFFMKSQEPHLSFLFLKQIATEVEFSPSSVHDFLLNGDITSFLAGFPPPIGVFFDKG